MTSPALDDTTFESLENIGCQKRVGIKNHENPCLCVERDIFMWDEFEEGAMITQELIDLRFNASRS
jgi:hypothetical protein